MRAVTRSTTGCRSSGAPVDCTVASRCVQDAAIGVTQRIVADARAACSTSRLACAGERQVQRAGAQQARSGQGDARERRLGRQRLRVDARGVERDRRGRARRAAAARRGTATRYARPAPCPAPPRRTVRGIVARRRARMRFGARGIAVFAWSAIRSRTPRASANASRNSRDVAGRMIVRHAALVGRQQRARAPIQRASPRARGTREAACDRRPARAPRGRARDRVATCRAAAACASAAASASRHRDSRVRPSPRSLAPAVAVAFGHRHRAGRAPGAGGIGFRRDVVARQPSSTASTHSHAASVSSRRTNRVPLPSSASRYRRS